VWEGHPEQRSAQPTPPGLPLQTKGVEYRVEVEHDFSLRLHQVNRAIAQLKPKHCSPLVQWASRTPRPGAVSLSSLGQRRRRVRRLWSGHATASPPSRPALLADMMSPASLQRLPVCFHPGLDLGLRPLGLPRFHRNETSTFPSSARCKHAHRAHLTRAAMATISNPDRPFRESSKRRAS